MPTQGFRFSGSTGNHHVGSHVSYSHKFPTDNPRKYTCLLLERIEEGLLDQETVIQACTKYMSESDVQDMMESNEFCKPDELD
tara:strand:+ start:59 stop:307 length:249 start_codon:yes stop_codon:yes gene_type:complete